LKDTTIQAKVPFLSVLDVLSIPPFFLSLFFTYRIFSFGLLCIISFDDLLSFPNALGRGRKRISISYSSVLLPPFVVLVVVFFGGDLFIHVTGENPELLALYPKVSQYSRMP
jgi:hypothetical protein